MPTRRHSGLALAAAASLLIALPAVTSAAFDFGTNGDDVIDGTDGRDNVFGGPGDDRIDAGPGRDVVVAGPGDDIVVVNDGTRDVVSCGRGHDQVTTDAIDVLARNCEETTVVPPGEGNGGGGDEEVPEN
jgi:Ca2+-binding RTX toxin-like protein